MEVPKFIGKYEIECLISKVCQRRIFYAIDNEKRRFAIKETLENQKESLQKEYEILNSITHPNIIKAVDCFEQDNKLYLVTPRADIDLLEYMSDQEIPEQNITKILSDLFSAVSFLHSKEICHRNISAENILFYKDQNNYVLSGFGNAFHFNDALTGEFSEHSPYVAPEIISGNDSVINTDKSKIDCFSLGVLMYVLYKKSFPFDENNTPRIDAIDLSGIPEQAADLITHLTCFDPNKRYSIQQALSHSYFQKQ